MSTASTLNMKIKINKPTPSTPVKEYPYFATNSSNDLLLFVKENYAIAVGYRDEFRFVAESKTTPLPVGTIITITV